MTSESEQGTDPLERAARRAMAIAAALDPAIPAEAATDAARRLAALDAEFTKASPRIRPEELMWDGPDFGPRERDEQ